MLAIITVRDDPALSWTANGARFTGVGQDAEHALPARIGRAAQAKRRPQELSFIDSSLSVVATMRPACATSTSGALNRLHLENSDQPGESARVLDLRPVTALSEDAQPEQALVNTRSRQKVAAPGQRVSCDAGLDCADRPHCSARATGLRCPHWRGSHRGAPTPRARDPGP